MSVISAANLLSMKTVSVYTVFGSSDEQRKYIIHPRIALAILSIKSGLAVGLRPMASTCAMLGISSCLTSLPARLGDIGIYIYMHQ